MHMHPRESGAFMPDAVPFLRCGIPKNRNRDLIRHRRKPLRNLDDFSTNAPEILSGTSESLRIKSLFLF